MPGQIIKRGDRKWLVRVSLGRDESGKRRTLNKMVSGNKKDAERTLTKTLGERDTGTLVEPARSTLNEYLDRWLKDAAKSRVRARTYQDYQEILARYIRPALGARRLAQLSPLDIQAAYNELQGRGLSARTVRYAHAVLRNALGQAVKWRLLSTNPATAVDLPRQQRREMHSLSPEEASRFLEHLEGSELRALFLLALTTGMRPGEYLGLQWKDVDINKGSLVVRRTMVEFRDGGWEFAEPKTARSYRTIPLPYTVTRVLADHKRHQAEQRLEVGPKYANHDLVFATPVGGPLNERNVVNRCFKPIVEAAGLPKSFRLYDLRHSCATLLLAEGEHPKVVSERLGHASITLTLDTYSHVLPTMQEGAAKRLEGLLFAKPADQP